MTVFVFGALLVACGSNVVASTEDVRTFNTDGGSFRRMPRVDSGLAADGGVEELPWVYDRLIHWPSPDALGGTIVDGTYELAFAADYSPNELLAAHRPRTRCKLFIRQNGRYFKQQCQVDKGAADGPEPVVELFGKLTTHDNELRVELKPANRSFKARYTATPVSLSWSQQFSLKLEDDTFAEPWRTRVWHRIDE